MFFAKEMNYLATRMAILSKTNALVDMLYNIPLKVLGTDEGKITTTDTTTDFDDIGFGWYVPSEEELVGRSMKKMENGEGFYETKISLEVSQESPRFGAIEETLNTNTKNILLSYNSDIRQGWRSNQQGCTERTGNRSGDHH